MFCTFVFTASCKGGPCCRTQGLFRGRKQWWVRQCVLASTSTMSCTTPRPTSCPPDVPIPAPHPPQQKKKSSSFPSTAGLRESNDDFRKLQERIEALLEEQDTTCNRRVQFGLYLMSMIPSIQDSLLVDFLDVSHRLLLQYVHRSDIIMLPETQQQQQQQ